jgi:hypothetical protein
MKREKTERLPADSELPRLLTLEGAMAFLASFSQLDLEGLREGDRMNLTADLRTVVAGEICQASTVSDEDLREAQRRVRVRLDDVAARNAFNAKVRRFEDSPFAEIILRGRSLEDLNGLRAVPGLGWRATSPKLAAAVDFVLCGTLVASHRGDLVAKRVRHCPGCQRLFFAEHKNSFFCSPKCSNRDAWERFRAKRQSTRRKKRAAG